MTRRRSDSVFVSPTFARRPLQYHGAGFGDATCARVRWPGRLTGASNASLRPVLPLPPAIYPSEKTSAAFLRCMLPAPQASPPITFPCHPSGCLRYACAAPQR